MSKFFERVKGIRLAVWAVLVFVVAMTIALAVEAEEQPHAVQIGLSMGVESSGGLKSQRIGYVHDKRWFVAYERVGGDYNDVNVYSAGRRAQLRRDHDWQPFFALGAAYSDELMTPDGKTKPHVSERLTFLLGLGMSYRLGRRADLEFGWDHNSTAGRSERNKGVDRIYLQYMLRF